MLFGFGLALCDMLSLAWFCVCVYACGLVRLDIVMLCSLLWLFGFFGLDFVLVVGLMCLLVWLLRPGLDFGLCLVVFCFVIACWVVVLGRLIAVLYFRIAR